MTTTCSKEDGDDEDDDVFSISEPPTASSLTLIEIEDRACRVCDVDVYVCCMYVQDGAQVKIRAPAATFDGIWTADCERHRTLVSAYEAVRGPGMVPGPRTASYDLYRVLCRSQPAVKMPSKVAAGAPDFYLSAVISLELLTIFFLTTFS
jgi:hypothetical protein